MLWSTFFTSVFLFLFGLSSCERKEGLELPDQIALTYPGPPESSVAISWRAKTQVKDGYVEFRKKGDDPVYHRDAAYELIDSKKFIHILNQPSIHRFSVILEDLLSNNVYEYRACNGTSGFFRKGNCTGWFSFTTAPDSENDDFAFIYMGDPQIGLEKWSQNYNRAIKRKPEVRFTFLAGDIVNHGESLSEYSMLFSKANYAFATRALLPALGNHDNLGRGSELYRRIFVLPENGPSKPEFDYWIRYGSLLFIVLDSNDPATFSKKAEWIKSVISKNPSRWRIAGFHHPVWSAGPGRDNKELRDVWMKVFEKEKVHLVLTGHDHSYVRTYPLTDGRKSESGPVYVISVSGSKFYERKRLKIFERAFTHVPTYQLIHVKPDSLEYTSYTWNDKVMDRFVINHR